MKILIADKFEQSGVDGLKALGCEVVYEPNLKDEALTAAVQSTGAQVLVVRSTPVNAAMLDAGQLSLIVRAGAGVNTIDVAAASQRGIYVSNCPGKNAVAVAELAFALMLALDRRVPDNVTALRAGQWNKKEFSKAQGLFGRTLGLIGFGSIGQEVARRARAFGMPVVVWSRRFTANADARRQAIEELGIEVVDGPEQVMARGDIVSVHLALTKETRGFVGASLLGHAKPGAMFINTARGEVVDYRALAEAIRDRGLRVGLDVFAHEPATAEGAMTDPILLLPNVIGTHHIGASTDQAQEAIAAETVRIVRTFVETGGVPNVVNLAKHTPATHMLVVRHRDKPGVLAHVFDRLRAANINVQETENIIFEGAHAAVARVNLDGEPPKTTLDQIQSGNTDVLDLQLIHLS
ncbi:MAG TPA: 3-phosphoglycerate dehydrogenase family protein [Vicinamibacterales bacterium]|nr:3-phosphoglycerate dehydrogenase family protein [Vicinamibacterales bacterium]